MKIRISAFILLVLSHQWVAPSAGTAAQRGSGEDLRIGADWSICLPPSPHRALVRASRDLQEFMKARHRLELKIIDGSASKSIVLAVEPSVQPDRFSIRADPGGGQLQIVGSSPRSARASKTT